MNALLGEFKGVTLSQWPTMADPRVVQSPFSGNSAAGILSNTFVFKNGGSEVDSHRVQIGEELIYRKPPQREGIISTVFAANQSKSQVNKKQFDKDLGALKANYVLRDEMSVSEFLFSHRSVLPILLAAAPELKKSFGEDTLLSLEVLSEEGEPSSLYAMATWRGSAEQAEIDLEDFDERWWLNQRPQHGLTFTYELA